MYLFAALAALAGLIAGIIVAVRRKKAEGVVYNKLDNAGKIINILLIPGYILLSLFVIALSIFIEPAYEGILGVLGWIVCVIIAAAPLSCGLGLGFSAALRKKGRSKKSFILLFTGLAHCALSIILFALFYDNLLSSLN